MLQVVHLNIEREKQKKRVPLYRDEAAIELLVKRIDRENNQRIEKLKNYK